MRVSIVLTASTASPSAAPGARLKLSEIGRELRLVRDRQRRRRALQRRHRRQRHLRAGAPDAAAADRASTGSRDRAGTSAAPPAPRGTGWPRRRWSRSGAGAKASFSVSVIALQADAELAGARARSTSSCARRPPSCASEETSRKQRHRAASRDELLRPFRHQRRVGAGQRVLILRAARLRSRSCTSCTGWK